MQFYRSFQLVIFFSLFFPMVSWAMESQVPLSENLQQLGLEAAQTKKPVMLVFAAKDCGYCERLEADHLGPMSISNEYHARVIIRKVLIDNYDDIRDFDGDARSGEDIADKYGVTVTPTVMMFNDKGKRLSKKLIGYNGNEYFGWDLDKLINTAELAISK
jgi:thioredoxin-related protein